MDNIEHHLIDIKNPDEDFSAGDFVSLASEKIETIKKKDKRIIITGGTWFYIKALLDNQELPPIKPDFKLREELEKLGSIELWAMLNKFDSKRASEINQNNKDKIIRSIEMCKSLNAPISEFKRVENKENNALWFSSDIEREILYQNINKRVDEMIKKGLHQEFQKLLIWSFFLFLFI